MMRFLPALILTALLPAACTQFPELDDTATPGVENAAYPGFLPLESVLEAPPPRASTEMLEGVQARADALRTRANGLPTTAPGPVTTQVSTPAPTPGSVGDRLARLRQKAEALRAVQ